jgi:predicted alpha/beta superfamily hydrolase
MISQKAALCGVCRERRGTARRAREQGETAMIKKWSVTYPAVNGREERRVYLYLPTMYDEDPQRRFPVLYMFDGHNVFFDEDATYGKSWGLGGYLDAFNVPLIVAAVECNPGANNERLIEYSPYRFDDDRFGHFDGRGKATLEWYIHRFKPYVDRRWRTLPDREHTFIAGSSMGGLMSLYALLHYNSVFSRAAALSPSLWVAPDKLYSLVLHTRLAPGSVLYMDYGSREMSNHDNIRKGYAEMTEALIRKGVFVTSRIVPEGTHSEASWERQLPFMIETLLYGQDE